MKRLIEKLKILLGIKTAICKDCKHYEYQPEIDYYYLCKRHRCHKYKCVKINCITGKQKVYLALCHDRNYNGRCLGFEEVQNKKLLDGVYCVPDGDEIEEA